nr:uncharacterized protein LOC112287379 [Physcomitrium patens]|eukprot:XP_024386087.1 uncharacterized protein LOC112287379 [Physcomitrella patens]
MQQAESYVQSGQTTFDTGNQGQMQRILPRSLPHVRQRIRRRNRTNRGIISNVHSVAAGIEHNNREQNTATSITGPVTSGTIVQTLQIEGSQERLSRLTSTITAIEESTGIGENFECNICFQKANEAVVTCCGHLFCWPCLYRWLHVHSYHKECPVCKGSLTEYSITPIYGRESALASARMQGALGTERIPPRPAARRIEGSRQQREREERESERELREAEARERTNQERQQVSEMEHEATRTDEGEQRPLGFEVSTIMATTRRVVDIPQESAATASRLQVMEHDVNQLGGETGESIEHSQSGYLQRRIAFRQEQLRQALANSRYNAAMNQNLEERDGERHQTLSASTVLSQEWENIINGSRLAVDPTQATAWLASMHARLANMEGNIELDADAAQQRRRMMASAASQGSQHSQEDTINHLAVHPSQLSDWITTMRNRLNNIEQLMQSLERPIAGNQMSQSIATTHRENLSSVRIGDTENLTPNGLLAEINATSTPQEVASGSEQSPNAADGYETGSERIEPEPQPVRSSRRMREHCEEASHVVALGEESVAHHEDQLTLARKRRRLD